MRAHKVETPHRTSEHERKNPPISDARQRHLAEQIEFLKASAASFDAGLKAKQSARLLLFVFSSTNKGLPFAHGATGN